MNPDTALLIGPVKNRVDVPYLLERLFNETEYHGELTFCPFHAHHRATPSLHIRDDGGYWSCYACHLHGDVIDFWRRAWFAKFRTPMSFETAVRSLGALAGVTITPGSNERLQLVAQLLREAPKRKPDVVLARMRKMAYALMNPLIRKVRYAGTSGSWGLAEWMSDTLDSALSGELPYDSAWSRIRDLEVMAVSHVFFGRRVQFWAGVDT